MNSCTVPFLLCIPIPPLHITGRGEAYFYSSVKVEQVVKLIYILACNAAHIKKEEKNLPL